MNIATMPNTATAKPFNAKGYTDADVARADIDLAIAFESMRAHWLATCRATTARELLEWEREPPPAILTRPADHELGIPGAPADAQDCGKRYTGHEIEEMRAAARYKKKGDAPRIQRLREIVAASDQLERDKRDAKAAEDRALKAAMASSRRLEQVIDKVANSHFTTVDGFALQALCLLVATEEGCGDGTDDYFDACKGDRDDWAAYKALVRQSRKLFPQLQTIAVFYRNEETCRFHPTF